MRLFSELYGAYFRAVAAVLSRKKLSGRDVERICAEEGFRETVLFLPKKLIPQKDGSDWGLLRRGQDGSLSPVTKKAPPKLLTRLQKSWLMAKLNEERMMLFLDEEEIDELRELLGDVPPLYDKAMFRYFDRFSDGDDFSDKHYRAVFRTFLAAIKRRETIRARFLTGAGKEVQGEFLPLKLEYSSKNYKLRVYCYYIREGRPVGSAIINLGRIRSAEPTGYVYKKKVVMNDYFAQRRCPEPAEIRLSTERNAMERFLMEFASYEKQTIRSPGEDGCTVRLWYDSSDETEVLIRLLSYGPTIEILGPADLRKQAARRVQRQKELLGL